MKKSESILIYKELLLPRYIEERMLLLLRKGEISKWFSGIGQEAIAVGATYALNDDDHILPMHRNLGVFTVRRIDIHKLFCQLMGKEGGFTKGRDRTFHFGCIDKHITGMISHLGAMLPVANGYALAYQLNCQKRVALAFVGDGATSEGDFHEALNLSAVWNLPVIFLIENNGYGLSTPTSQQYRCKDLVDRAKGYGMRGIKIDGNDVIEVISAVKESADYARNGKGPTLIEATTFRMRGHEEASGTKYVPKELFAKWVKNDPISRFEDKLRKQTWFSDTLKAQLNNEIKNKVLPAMDFALNEPLPKSTEIEEKNDIFSPITFTYIKPSGKKKKNRFIDAINETLEQKMAEDKSVLIMGQDIAEYGGVFKATEGLLEKYGNQRIRNTPIIESGIIGTAMGLAIEGFKPVVEMQFADFISCGFNQIVNNLAKNYYRWGVSPNVTIRMPSGGGIGAGPFHSQNPEAWFFHVPGLKIVYPSNPEDAKGLLNSSIDDPNPVLFFEHKGLYRSIKSDVDKKLFHIPIGKASIVNKGEGLSIFTYGKGVEWAVDSIKRLKINAEIIDLRSLMPFDEETIIESVVKTNRAIVLHEANLTGGIGAEIAAIISEKAFEHLDAPVARVASLDTPVPFAANIESEIYLPLTRLDEKIKILMNY